MNNLGRSIRLQLKTLTPTMEHQTDIRGGVEAKGCVILLRWRKSKIRPKPNGPIGKFVADGDSR
jgi:hypothetical protein